MNIFFDPYTWVIQQDNDLPLDTLALVTRTGNSAIDLQFIQRPSAFLPENSSILAVFLNSGIFKWKYLMETSGMRICQDSKAWICKNIVLLSYKAKNPLKNKMYFQTLFQNMMWTAVVLFWFMVNSIWSAWNESHCSFNLLTVFLLKRKEIFFFFF